MDRKALFVTLKEQGYKLDFLYNLYAKSVDLNFTSILVLQLLHDATEVYTQKDICEKLGLPKHLVNVIIKSFWEQGFVKLKEAKDRRNKEIIVTSKGKKYAISVLKPLEDIEFSVWDSLSDEELTTFVRAMERYVESFESVLNEIVKY